MLEWLFLVISTSVLIALVFILDNSIEDQYENKEKIIVKIGGGNRRGYHGVMYDDGTTGKEYLPVEGQKVLVRVKKEK